MAEELMNLDWNCTINDKEDENHKEFVTLPEGTYDFKIVQVTKEWYNGSAKMEACNRAVLKLQIDTNLGTSVFTERIPLISSYEWKLSQFFICLGMKKKGEPFQMTWDIEGKGGKAKIKIREYDNGEEIKKFNCVDRFLEPEVKDYGWN